MSGHQGAQGSPALARQNYQAGFKQTLINSLTICEKKCVKVSDEDRLSHYEKACLGKCFDKYYGIYEKNSNSINGALSKKQAASEYDENF